MSKRSVISLTQIEEMKQLVVTGVPPHKIAEMYNISPSTVHNYKTKFRSEGLVFADIKGGRVAAHKEYSGSRARTTPSAERVQFTPKGQSNGISSEFVPHQTHTKNGTKFVVNGTSIHINSAVKLLTIDKTGDALSFEIIL